MTAATTAPVAPAAQPKPRSVFAVRDFRLLWFGEAISALGDQFAMIALPWLALLLTGSAFALGTVLAVMAVPRAVLMLVGGAYVDRLSPRRVMLVSNAVRFVAVTLLGVIVLAGAAELWMLYIFGLVFGIADAFFYPAQTAITPELVAGDQLQQANGITQGTTQFTVLIGPAIAGVAIAALGATSARSSSGQTGVGLALLIDGLTFIASLLTLWLIRPRAARGSAEQGSVVAQIREGVGFVLKTPVLPIVMVMSMAVNFLITGPIEVGLPLLAFSRLPEGAAAFGLILAAFGGGSLLGMIGATVVRKPSPERFGTVVLGLMAVAGIAFAALAFVNSTIGAIAIAAIVGAAIGYTNVSFITWVQLRIPRQLMGRVMSFLMFGSLALVPISIAIAGVLVEISLDGVMLVAGLGMALLSGITLLSPRVRGMGMLPPLSETEDADAGSTDAGPSPEPVLAA
jgi:MFS family permease